ncbi:MAG: hypothetical protein J6M23_08280 [Bacteroidales bacterium]|nr:hypothetical protein [Bacteroidales bacterium]
MKKLFNISLAALAAMVVGLTACNKNPQPEVVTEPENPAEVVTPDPGLLVVSVNPENGIESKVAGASATAAESAIKSLQVFVFYGETKTQLGQTENNLETDIYKTYDGTENHKTELITTTVGQKYIYALANAPRLRGITTVNSLKEQVMNLGYNSIPSGGLVMAGAFDYSWNEGANSGQINVLGKKKEITAYTQNQPSTYTTVSINLYRLAARIELQSIEVDFTGTDLEGQSFTVEEIYLKNVPNGVRMDGQNSTLLSGDMTYWTNKISKEASPKDKAGLDVTGLVFESIAGEDKNILAGGSGNPTKSTKTYGRYFYSYPNPITTDVTGGTPSTFTQRRTRIVIHAKIGGVDSYYPVSIADPTNFIPADSSTPANSATHSQIVGNHKYVISKMKITSKGLPDDTIDEPIVTGRAEVTVTVQDWNGNTVLNYDI